MTAVIWLALPDSKQNTFTRTLHIAFRNPGRVTPYVMAGVHQAGEAGEGAYNLYKQQNLNMAAYAKISNIHIWRLWGNPQAEGNVKLEFHTSASLTAVS